MEGSYTKDLKGVTFGGLKVLEKSHRNKYGAQHWLCLCSCGSLCTPRGADLKTGRTKSCGCLRGVVNKQRATHNLSQSRLYRVWGSIVQRCKNSNNSRFSSYGGRGITICVEWRDSFESFYYWAIDNGYEEGLTIDRIDNDGSYSPDNCRWITWNAQRLNTRHSFIISYRGKTQTLTEWAAELGIEYHVLYMLLKYLNWSAEEAFSTPAGKRHKLRGGISHNGECLSAEEWGQRIGLSGRAIRYRLAAGKSVEEALQK